MIERLETIEKRYQFLSEELVKPENLSDIKKTMELSKEQASLKDAYDAYQEYKKVLENIKEAKELVKDPEMAEFAREELEANEQKKETLESQLEILLLPKDPNDGKNVIVEIRGAAGGDEGNIFAGDLYDMYHHYAEKEGWKVEVLEEEKSEAGGFSFISFMVKGENVYSKLKYESGAHRVQRVPSTETQGRVHTSTATVLVMPEAEEVDYTLDMNEVRIDITRSSGCGGQGVNTTDSAVRITHLPTKIVVTCQNERSQIKNKEIAMEVLKSKLYQLELAKKEQQLKELKGNQRQIDFGSQRRTYVLHPYKIVKDHLTNTENNNAEKVLDGDLDEFIYDNLRREGKDI